MALKANLHVQDFVWFKIMFWCSFEKLSYFYPSLNSIPLRENAVSILPGKRPVFTMQTGAT